MKNYNTPRQGISVKLCNLLFSWVILLLSAALLGCEDVPQLPRVAEATPIADGVVTESGRGSYDWFSVNGVFDVTAPSELEVLSQVDREVVRANLPNLTFTERTEPYRPAGMEDDVYYTYSRLTEPYFDTKPFLTIPFPATANGMYCVNSTGDRLMLLGKQLEVWDLQASKRLTASPLPSSKCTRVICDMNPEQALVMDSTAVYRVVAASGQVLTSWQPPHSDEPVFVVRAANSATYAVSTKSKKMYALGEDLQTTHEFKGPLLDLPLIAIRPDANWVLGLANGIAFRWHISPNREEMEKLGGLGKEEQVLMPIAGSFIDYLVEPQVYAICYNDRETQQLKLLNCDMNPLTHASGMGTVDGTQEWITSCMSRPNREGTRQYFLQDLNVEAGVFSVEFPLGPEPVLEMSMDQLTDVCAIRDARQLRIYRRQRWKDFSGAWTLERLTQLALDGRFEQLELTANDLRKQPRLRNNYGEGYYMSLAETIGSKWAELEIDKSANNDLERTKSDLQTLEKWKSKGSELAILSSGFRHYAIGQKARGTGYVDTVSQSGWDELGKRNESIEKEIRPLLKMKEPSLALLRLAILNGMQLGKAPKDLQPFIKQLIEGYPYSAANHMNLCLHMLPRWGGSPGEGGAYLGSVADLLPQPHADLLYTRVAINFGSIFGTKILMPDESGISVSRVLRSVEPLMERQELRAHDVEFLIKLANEANRADLVEKLANYHVRNFALNRFAQADYARTLLGSARNAMSKAPGQ